MSDYQTLRREVSRNLQYHPMFQGQVEKHEQESETTGSSCSLSNDDEIDCRSQENFMENSSENILVHQLKARIAEAIKYKSQMEQFFNKEIDNLKAESKLIENQNDLFRTTIRSMKSEVKEIRTDLNSLQNHLKSGDSKLRVSVKLEKNVLAKDRKISLTKSGKLLRFSSNKNK